MAQERHVRDHYLPPDPEAFRRAEPPTGRVIVIAPTRAACETIELALKLQIETVLEREHGEEIRDFARRGLGFGIVAGTGTGKTLAIRPIAEVILQTPLKVGVVNREREATPETPTWNVVIVTTGIARRWFQDNLINRTDTLIVDEIHQTSAELELCLALGKRVGSRFVWLSATVDPEFYARYLNSAEVLETSAFDPAMAARVESRMAQPLEFLSDRFIKRVMHDQRGVAVFVPTRAEVEKVAAELGEKWPRLTTAFYHGGEPIRVIRPFLEGETKKPFLLAMTAAGQSALNIRGLDTVVIYDARYGNLVQGGRNVLTRQYLGANEILQMAGRVHGRVPNGEVYILTDRNVDFASLKPTPPEFQLAGDTERVALTAAALGIDLTELDLPVPLDRRSYRESIARLERRGVVENGRLTAYGRAVEAMPVDRQWGELLYHAGPELIPFVAVSANIDSLHRMTRDPRDLTGLTVAGSDHLTAYNVFAEAVNKYGHLGQVYELPRHLFTEELDEWAEGRGVLVKAIEDIALGTASVYRTLELPLPERFPYAGAQAVRGFRELLAGIMPFDLAIEQELADGRPVRISRGSMCGAFGAVAGTVRYFADPNGVARAAIEGTNIPFEVIKRYAAHSGRIIEYREDRKHRGLMVAQKTEYAGFELERQRSPVPDPFPEDLAEGARDALVGALIEDRTSHPDQRKLSRARARLDEYWRRSGGKLPEAAPDKVRELIRKQLDGVKGWNEFLATRLDIDVDAMVPAAARAEWDALPVSLPVLGDRVPLSYEIEGGVGVARVRLREGQARRLRATDLPALDRPLRFAVSRKHGGEIKAESIEALKSLLTSLPSSKRPPKQHHQRRSRRH